MSADTFINWNMIQWRDVKRVGYKLFHVLIPRGKSDAALRDCKWLLSCLLEYVLRCLNEMYRGSLGTFNVLSRVGDVSRIFFSLNSQSFGRQCTSDLCYCLGWRFCCHSQFPATWRKDVIVLVE